MAHDCLTGTELHSGKCQKVHCDKAVPTFRPRCYPCSWCRQGRISDHRSLPWPRCQANTFPFKNVKSITHYRVCLVVSCFHSICTTGSWPTKKTSRPKSTNSSSPLKAFPQVEAGKPQKSSSIYTTIQYFQPPNAQGTTSMHCLTISWDSLWATVFLNSPRSSLWTLQMLKELVYAAF